MVDIPEKWRNVTLPELRGHVAEMVEDMKEAGAYIGLGVPALPSTINGFFQMFRCQRCGHCCRERTGSGVILTPADVERLATHLDFSKKKFKELHTLTRDGSRFLRSPCPFFKSDPPACAVHSVRPQVCQLYPVNMPVKATGIDLRVDGVYILNVDSFCPEGRRVAIAILEYQAAIALGEAPAFTQAAALWNKARQVQRKALRPFG